MEHWGSRLAGEGIQARRIVVRGLPAAAILEYGVALPPI